MKTKKHFTKTIIITGALLLTSLSPVAVAAASPSSETMVTNTTPISLSFLAQSGATSTSFTLLPAWYKGIDGGTNGGLKSPSDVGGLQKYLSIIALNLITDLLYIAGYVSLGFIIWGGFKFMIMGDNSSGVAAARKTIQNAVIGLVLSISAVAIVNAISGAFGA